MLRNIGQETEHNDGLLCSMPAGLCPTKLGRSNQFYCVRQYFLKCIFITVHVHYRVYTRQERASTPTEHQEEQQQRQKSGRIKSSAENFKPL